MPVSWIDHRGHRILYVDYRNLGASACLETLAEQVAAIEAAPEPVLTLVDARGARFNGEFMEAAKAAGSKNTLRTRRRAVVGSEGFKKVLLVFFNLAAAPVAMEPFTTLEEALAYLTRP
jgi:hypothetical protein